MEERTGSHLVRFIAEGFAFALTSLGLVLLAGSCVLHMDRPSVNAVEAMSWDTEREYPMSVKPLWAAMEWWKTGFESMRAVRITCGLIEFMCCPRPRKLERFLHGSINTI